MPGAAKAFQKAVLQSASYFDRRKLSGACRKVWSNIKPRRCFCERTPLGIPGVLQWSCRVHIDKGRQEGARTFSVHVVRQISQIQIFASRKDQHLVGIDG